MCKLCTLIIALKHKLLINTNYYFFPMTPATPHTVLIVYQLTLLSPTIQQYLFSSYLVRKAVAVLSFVCN